MRKQIWMWTYIAIMAFSCQDIIVEDISSDKVTQVLPQAGTVTGTAKQDFRWNAVEGAEQYQFTIVTPSYSQLTAIVLDTVVTGTNFKTTLVDGTYEWCVRALNSAYTSEYSCSALQVRSGQITLNSPADNESVTTEKCTFSWEGLTGVSSYQLKVTSSTGAVVLNETVNSTLYTAALKSGKYQWCVRSIVSGVETTYTCRSVDIAVTDITSKQIKLLSPADSLSVAVTQCTFLWDSLPGASSYQLLIASPDHVIDTTISGMRCTTAVPPGKYQWCVRGANSSSKTAYSCRTLEIVK